MRVNRPDQRYLYETSFLTFLQKDAAKKVKRMRVFAISQKNEHSFVFKILKNKKTITGP